MTVKSAQSAARPRRGAAARGRSRRPKPKASAVAPQGARAGRVGNPQARELAELRVRLAEAESTLRAIRTGEADAVVTGGRAGIQVFTLEGAEHVYRRLIESMNEGALTLATDKLILYANQCFARMVKCPLAQVMGSSFRRFLSPADRDVLAPLLKRRGQAGAKISVQLRAVDGTRLPVQISLRPTARNDRRHATIGMVVTDLTEARRTEELLRALTRRVVQGQEVERGRVALELHDNITQLLCGVLFRSQALADSLSAHDGPARGEAVKLRRILGQTALEVERIASDLRPSVLAQLGLDAVLRSTGAEFASETGVGFRFISSPLSVRLPADTEVTLYRILQEALRNVQRHARARQVTVTLVVRPGAEVQLTIHDDGVGFDPHRPAGKHPESGHLGLVGMRERATYVGGSLRIESRPRSGTTLDVRVPLA